jgi:hypothetical protein
MAEADAAAAFLVPELLRLIFCSEACRRGVKMGPFFCLMMNWCFVGFAGEVEWGRELPPLVLPG